MKKVLSLLLFLFSISAFGQIETTTSKDCYLVYDFNGKEFLKNKKLKAGTKITVFKENETYDIYYHVRYKDIEGCIKENCITVNDDIDKLFEIKRTRIRLAHEQKLREDSILKVNANIARMNEKKRQKETYGKWYDLVMARKVVVGMPEDFIKSALGTPKSVSETVTGHKYYRMYVYKDMYIHASNGKIVTIQKTNLRK